MWRRALKIDEASLGPNHPSVALGLNNVAYLLETQQKWAEALPLLERAKPIMIGRRATGERESGVFGKAVLAHNVGGLKDYARVLYRADAKSTKNLRVGFEIAQWALQNEAADAVSSMSTRFAKGDARLAELVREEQDLLASKEAAYRSLDQAAGKADIKAGEALRARIADIEARLKEVSKRLRRDFPDFAEFSDPRPLALKEVQGLLEPNQAIVLLNDVGHVGTIPEETIVFAITKEDARWMSIPWGLNTWRAVVPALRCGLDSSLWRAGDESRELCKALLKAEVSETKMPPFDASLAYQLYQNLFAGIEDLIKDKSLFVVSSGPLTQLPFEVLVTEKPDEKLPPFEAYAKAAWLGQRQPIIVLPSVGSLKALRTAKTSTAAAPFLGFGNPLLTGLNGTDTRAFAKQTCAKASPPGKRTVVASLYANVSSLFRGGEVNVEDLRQQPPLPETADELCAAARGLGVADAGLDQAVYLGERDTVTQIKALSASGELARARVVHFATHGLIAGETAQFAQNKAEPSLVFTPPAKASEEDSGLLTASEVAQLNMDADWVVMSACNTAAGQGENAEALSGLARAFFYAGARSLLVSHWPVNSEAAVAITTGTINTMKADPKIGRAEALRRSISALIAKGGEYAHPSMWGPFVLVGNGGLYRSGPL